MPRAKKLDVYRTVNANTKIRIYEPELRKLFKLPARKGQITGAEFSNGRLNVTFLNITGGSFNI